MNTPVFVCPKTRKLFGPKNFAGLFRARYFKLSSILRRYHGFIMTASWEKIYSLLGGVAKRQSLIGNIFSPNAIIIKP